MAPKLTVPPSHFALNSIDECCWFKITTFIECPIVGANSQGRIKWATAAPTQKPPVVKQNEPSSRVVDLCHTITYSGVSPSLGCLADTENRYHIFPISETGPAESISESISLESLLSKRSLVRLTRRERYVIALTIACSHLQLHDSPWLAAQWSKKDSLFHCRKNHGIIREQPYITRFFHSIDEALDGQSAYVVADHGLSTLGILLLELCFGIALEDPEIRKKFVALDGRPNPCTSAAAVKQTLILSIYLFLAFCVVGQWGKAAS